MPGPGQVPMREGALDRGAVLDILTTMEQLPVAYSGAADVLAYPGLAMLTGANADAMTLAAPIAGNPLSGGDDGKCVSIVDTTGKAHTVTTPANKVANNKHILTFNGTIGSSVSLQAYQGIWYPVGTPNGVTIT